MSIAESVARLNLMLTASRRFCDRKYKTGFCCEDGEKKIKFGAIVSTCVLPHPPFNKIAHSVMIGNCSAVSKEKKTLYWCYSVSNFKDGTQTNTDAGKFDNIQQLPSFIHFSLWAISSEDLRSY